MLPTLILRTTFTLAAGLALLATRAAAQFDSPMFDGLFSPTKPFYISTFILLDANGDGRRDALIGLSDITRLSLSDATGGFAPPYTVPVPDGQLQLAAGDLDGDGDEDAVGMRSNGHLDSLLNSGDGSFVALQGPPTNNVYGPALGDFNDDGVPDVVARQGAQLNVYFGLGDGHFATLLAAGSAVNAEQHAVADMDGDGELDVVSAATGAWCAFGDGTGKLGGNTLFFGNFDTSLVLPLDTDADGDTDLVAAEVPPPFGQGSTLLVGKNAGGASFTDVASQPLPVWASMLVAADVVDDSPPDVLALGFAALAVAPGDGAGGLRPVQRFATFGYVGTVVADDRNGDGALDVVMPFQDSFFELRGDGQGGLKGTRSWLLQAEDAGRPTSGDLDGDGLTDAIVALPDANELQILLGDGKRHLRPALALPTANLPDDVALLDLDLDGDLDVTCGFTNVFQLASYANEGGLVFGAPVQHATLATGVGGLLAADMDVDGASDVVGLSTTPNIDQICVFRGDGLGSFHSAQVSGAGSNVNSFDVGSLDADALPDVVVSVTSPTVVRVLHGNGSGGFLPPQAIVAGASGKLRGIRVTDVDGDTGSDIVVLNQNQADIVVLHGDGTGGFGAPIATPTMLGARFLEAGDLDGDGLADLVVSQDNATFVLVHFATAAGVQPGQHVEVGPGGRRTRLANLDHDAFPEILVALEGPGGLAVVDNHGPSPWTALGSGLAGVHGVPLLDGSGVPLGGGAMRLSLSRAAPLAMTMLVIGPSLLFAPLKGGVLGPAPALVLPVAADAWGQWVLDAHWPAGVAPGTQAFFQAWLPDVSASQGWAASSAVQLEVP